MKHQSKSDQLYERLKRDIQSGRYAPGSRFAPEVTLASELGVSRWSLRPALTQLEAEGLISRSQKRGTMVAHQQFQPPVTLLLPCSEHLLQSSYNSMRALMQLYSGLMAGCVGSNCTTETLPVTLDNHPQHLDWPRLQRLNADSRVVLPGFWYEYLFDFLLERGCRVCIIDHMTYKHHQYGRYLAQWQVFELDIAGITRAVVNHLYDQGCRKLAIATAFVNEPDQPSTLNFWRCVLEYGLTPYCLPLTGDGSTAEKLREELRSFHHLSQFDGLLLECLNVTRPHPCMNFKQHLGLPDSVQLVTMGECEESTSSHISGYEFRMREIGFRMAQLLTASDFFPGHHRGAADLYCRASSLQSEIAINQ